jgi:hypothetical protein
MYGWMDDGKITDEIFTDAESHILFTVQHLAD